MRMFNKLTQNVAPATRSPVVAKPTSKSATPTVPPLPSAVQQFGLRLTAVEEGLAALKKAAAAPPVAPLAK